ncbi:hypothetical protein SAMN05216604_10454 [Pseudomonas agarici]|nr:hypothetical protein SAMN05216604_10454 [Pseudomonas agarici]
MSDAQQGFFREFCCRASAASCRSVSAASSMSCAKALNGRFDPANLMRNQP